MRIQLSALVLSTLFLSGCAATSSEIKITVEDLTGLDQEQLTEEVRKLCPEVMDLLGTDSADYLSQRIASLDELSAPEEVLQFISENEWVAQEASRNTKSTLARFVSRNLQSWVVTNDDELRVSGVEFAQAVARANRELLMTTIEQCQVSELLDANVALEKKATTVIASNNDFLDAQKQLEREAAEAETKRVEAERKAEEAAANQAKDAEERAEEARYNALFLPSAPRHPDLKVEYFSCAGLGWGDTAARLKVRNTSNSEILAYAMVVWLNSRGEVLGAAGAEAATFPGLVSNLDVPLPSDIRAYSDCKIAELFMFGEQ